MLEFVEKIALPLTMVIILAFQYWNQRRSNAEKTARLEFENYLMVEEGIGLTINNPTTPTEALEIIRKAKLHANFFLKDNIIQYVEMIQNKIITAHSEDIIINARDIDPKQYIESLNKKITILVELRKEQPINIYKK